VPRNDTQVSTVVLFTCVPSVSRFLTAVVRDSASRHGGSGGESTTGRTMVGHEDEEQHSSYSERPRTLSCQGQANEREGAAQLRQRLVRSPCRVLVVIDPVLGGIKRMAFIRKGSRRLPQWLSVVIVKELPPPRAIVPLAQPIKPTATVRRNIGHVFYRYNVSWHSSTSCPSSRLGASIYHARHPLDGSIYPIEGIKVLDSCLAAEWLERKACF
jgi:hypothetical protein